MVLPCCKYYNDLICQLQSRFYVVLLKNEISVLESFRQHRNSKIIVYLVIGRRNLSYWCLNIKRRMGKKILIDCFSIFWMVKYGKMLYSTCINAIFKKVITVKNFNLLHRFLKKASEFDESTSNIEFYWKVLNPQKIHEKGTFFNEFKNHHLFRQGKKSTYAKYLLFFKELSKYQSKCLTESLTFVKTYLLIFL